MNEKKSEGMDREMDRGMDRRAFLKGALATAAASGAFALGGCAPAGSADASSDKEAAGANLVDHGVFKSIDMAEAEPIAPVDPPATWDGEADIVVVGTGGGGLAAMNYAVDNGSTVIAIEKNAEIGGATQHAAGWFLLPGGSKDQEALQYAYPSYPFDINAFMRAILPNYQFSIDDELLKNIALKAGGGMDWLQEHDGVEMTCRGQAFMDTKVIRSSACSPPASRWAHAPRRRGPTCARTRRARPSSSKTGRSWACKPPTRTAPPCTTAASGASSCARAGSA